MGTVGKTRSSFVMSELIGGLTPAPLFWVGKEQTLREGGGQETLWGGSNWLSGEGTKVVRPTVLFKKKPKWRAEKK